MAQTLKSLLGDGEFIIAPGVFEMLSARIADRMGFKALYMTGYGISASHLGLPDAGLVTYRDTMKGWEIVSAPSVTQKKFFIALGKLDALFGSPLYRLVRMIEMRILKKFSEIHPASLFEAEEDGMILMHIFEWAWAFYLLPFAEVFWPHFVFDQKIDSGHRARVMNFYKRCVQNHLYVFGQDKIFLSKNPLFSTMIQSLDEVFPDAKFIYLARTPFATVPSAISIACYYFNTLMSPLEPYPYLTMQLEILDLYYSCPLIKFTELPESRQQAITYADLIEKPEQTVAKLYARFGIELSPAYAQALRNEQEKARRNRFLWRRSGTSAMRMSRASW